jgi:phage shock protein PspC (stress-responsive transcriptional regulator)
MAPRLPRGDALVDHSLPKESITMETTETIREPRRLTRPRDGRWLGGVSAGLGAYFDLSPAIYRIAFVALALAGGTGILLYVAAWLVIPDEAEDDSIAATMLKRNRDHPSRAIGLALLAFVAVLALSSARFWPSPANLWLAAAIGGGALVLWQVGGQREARGRSLFPIALGVLIAVVGVIAILDITGTWSVDWRIVLGAMVVVLGGLIAAGASTGRAVGALVTLAVLLLLALVVALVVRVPIFAGIGDRAAHPTTLAALDDEYELGIGDFAVNLADVPLPAGETHVKATLGIGDLSVKVPRDVTVVVDGRVNAGRATVLGRTDSGRNVHEQVTTRAGDPTRTLVLDAHVGIGDLEVQRR